MPRSKTFTGRGMDCGLDPQRRRHAEQADSFRHSGWEVLMDVRQKLLAGQVIPAHPLALTAERKLDERRQRALTRYYVDSGAGGIAVGVHTTQFEIRDHGLYRPVLELAAESVDHQFSRYSRELVKVAGICGKTEQALNEAETAASLGYHAGLISPGAWKAEPESAFLDHCRTVSETIPLFGFYLQ